MDTIYAEGQRRYVESLSAYARQFVNQMQKPKLDHIECVICDTDEEWAAETRYYNFPGAGGLVLRDGTIVVKRTQHPCVSC